MNDRETALLITRLDRFSGQLKRMILPESVPLDVHLALSDGETPFARRRELTFHHAARGQVWGRNWQVAWFRVQGQIPPTWHGRTVCARLDVGGEGLVYDAAGSILQGISAGSVFDSDFSRDIVRLHEPADHDGTVDLWIEATAAALFGLVTIPDPPADSPDRYGRLEAKLNAAELCVFDDAIWSLWLDVESIRSLIRALPPAAPERRRVIDIANDTIAAFSKSTSPADCRRLLEVVFGRRTPDPPLTVTAVGHAHIDTAWLWPVRETIRKCARTFASQLELLTRYPDYVFGASQAQHYAFVRDHYPALYERIKTEVKKGRWEIQGGMWVEADGNLPDGESLIRQILHGKNFFADEFGVDVDNLWLPDVFGYSAALPQILVRSGILYFLTQKLSWNQTNTFPHHTFVWEGIDRSRVVSHFPPEDTYGSSLQPESLIRGAERYQQTALVGEFLSLFGVGDGGGGPKDEHIEHGCRQRSLRGAPPVRFGRAADFFARVDAAREWLPVWSGELYLELHRGTLTTQARMKHLNRRCEQMLRAAEKLSSCLPLTSYPRDEFDALWKTVLKNQFHDIIPGSSITEVYRVAETELETVLQTLNELTDRTAAQLFTDDDDSLVLFNPTHYPFDGPIVLPDDWTGVTVSGDATPLPAQCDDGRCSVRVGIGPYALVTLRKTTVAATAAAIQDNLVLENELVRYEFAPDGRLIRAFDTERQREIIPGGHDGNVLTHYDDRPNNWDAWDIDIVYEQAACETQRGIEHPRALAGPVRRSLQFRMQIGDSIIDQTVTLAAGSKRLDFVTAVSWHESHKMLRVAFPVDIVSDYATFDIQYGYLRRPTHRNTSWDSARFEVVAHRYADLSEPDYGVALLNDCKYGHKVHRNVLDLCLLRAPTYPDPDADRGQHTLTYSLLPHTGDLAHSDVIAQAAILNRPPLMWAGRRSARTRLPVHLDADGISLEVIKAAEKEDCLILRLVETRGCHSTGTLHFEKSTAALEETDLMEWQDGHRHECRGTFDITLGPFEIRTYKLKGRDS